MWFSDVSDYFLVIWRFYSHNPLTLERLGNLEQSPSWREDEEEEEQQPAKQCPKKFASEKLMKEHLALNNKIMKTCVCGNKRVYTQLKYYQDHWKTCDSNPEKVGPILLLGQVRRVKVCHLFSVHKNPEVLAKSTSLKFFSKKEQLSQQLLKWGSSETKRKERKKPITLSI